MMDRKAVAAALAAALAASALAKESGTTFARDALQKYVDSGEIPGIITVFCKGDEMETTCLGYGNVEAKRPIGLDDIFQQCSQTKSFCGVSVAMLVEEGKIGLDDPVSKYLPEFAELWVQAEKTTNAIRLVKAKRCPTVKMCLTHTSGLVMELPNYERMGGWSRRMPLRSVAATAAAVPLYFEPGSRVRYSNVGMDTAAAIVEVVTRLRWEKFLEERLFKPLGMTNSTFCPTDEQLSHKIDIYTVRRGQKAKWVRQMPAMQEPYNDDRVFPSAGAGLWTTARDQIRFYKMLMNLGRGENGVRILKEETVRNLLARSLRPKGCDPEGYSLGCVAPFEDGENEWFGHGGAWASQGLVNWHRKEMRLVVVQYDGGYGFRKIAADAANLFFQHVVNDAGVDAYTGRMQ